MMLWPLSNSEPTIAGKTHSEILSMKKWTRKRWYKTILPEEKEEAMQIVEIARQAMHSEFMKANNPMRRPEVIAKRSGMNNSFFGKTHTEEAKDKCRAAAIEQWKDPVFRAKIKVNMSGENNPSFNNWSSRAPYCHLWNESLREGYRNYWGRVCVLSDTLRSVMGPESGLDDFEGHEIFSKHRLSVHHIRGDKMAGCNGAELALIPLQNSFNNKKFDGFKLEDHPFHKTLFLLKDIERRHREEMLGAEENK